MKKLLFTLGILSLILGACSSDSTEIVQEDKWVVEYYASSSYNSKPANTQAFIEWCEAHEDILQYSIPSQDLNFFSYESASALKWKEITTSELDAIQKVNEFNSIIGNNELTTSGANYRKYDPNFKGPWRVAYTEVFFMIHNDTDEFNKWYNDNLSYLWNGFFFTSSGLVSASAQEAFSYYDKCLGGHLYWIVEIPRASEQEIQLMVDRFQSFSIVDNSEKLGFDTFVADYSPIVP